VHRYARFCCATIAAALAPGCASPVPHLYPIPDSQFGTYRFSDRVHEANPPIVVEGEFTIRADTILASVTTGICQPEIPPQTQSFTFQCGPVTLSFDRRNPLQRATYEVQGTAMVLRRECLRYEPGRSGISVCVAYTQEEVQVVRTFSGQIRPIPVP